MKIMGRYIGKTILSSIGLVTLVLIALQMFILFVAELDDLGIGDYNFAEAFLFIIMQMPYQVYLFFPVATLIGCLIGLGALASNSELIAIRSAGATVFQLAMATMKAAIILIAIVTVFGETLMYQWVHTSAERKILLRSGNQEFAMYHNSIWLRNDDSFIYIGELLPNNKLRQVKQYQFDQNHQLVLTRAIESGEYRDGQWWVHGIRESKISPERITVSQINDAPWNVTLPTSLLTLMNTEPNQMSLRELHHYIHLAHESHQAVYRYELDFWQRIFQPLASCVMVFLAIPFIFGPLRESSMGSRIVLGTFFGFGFHLINKFFGSVSLVYQFSPLIGAACPTILFGALAFFMMRRVK